MAPTTTSASTTATSSPTPTCLHIEPGKNGYLPPEACGAILLYKPSLVPAAIFFILFGFATLLHFIQTCLHRKLYALVIVMGSGWEFIAMACRSMETRHQDSSSFYVYFMVFFLVAPIWINAFLYMTLGRMVQFFVPEQNLIRISAQRFGLIFVCLDVFAFIIQLIGVGILVQTDAPTDTVLRGVHIYMGGIAIQETFIICFIGLTIHLHRKLLNLERTGVQLSKMSNLAFNWKWLFYTMYFALTMITVILSSFISLLECLDFDTDLFPSSQIRIAFRLAEYSHGTSSDEPTNTHEWYQYVFDALPMFFAVFIFNIFHPGRILQGPDSGFRHAKKIAKMEKKQRKFEKQNLYPSGGNIPLAPYPRNDQPQIYSQPSPIYPHSPPRSYFA